VEDELSHYALDTWDIEYEFPFGWKELQGLSNRTDFDLKQHMEHSKTDLSIFDEETKKKIIPHVICEPSQGVERAFLVFMFDAYHYDKSRDNVVLKLHPKLAPVKIGVFPLVSNKKEIVELAKKIHNELKECWTSAFDISGSIGRRYARADEAGIYACITVDFESLEDDCVTIRSRDTTEQIRVKISDLKDVVKKIMKGEKFSSLGKSVE
jgi:glycyl-tRNA synthetase